MRSGRADEEDVDMFKFPLTKEFSCRIVKLLFILLVFLAGLVFGLVARANLIKSQSNLFFSPATAHTSQPPTLPTIPSSSCRSVGNTDHFNFTIFLHPPHLTHSFSDDQLFWRASMVPTIDTYPYHRVPKLAFLFLTRGPLPLSPLWDRFFRGHEHLFSIYIHAPPGYKLNVSKTSAFYGRQIPSQIVHWGSVELVDSEKRLLANALLDFSNERFVLLSESCIPVYEFDTVYKYLVGSQHSFVESYDDPSRYGRGRYPRKMFPTIKLNHWRKGSQWFEMDRALAVNIISDTSYYSLFRKYCKPSCYPDEHYLPTYLNMFFGALNANRSVTWVDWSKGGPHPATYGRVDITEGFIQSIRNNRTMCTYNSQQTSVCYLFARKFDPSALEPLLNLSSTVMKF